MHMETQATPDLLKGRARDIEDAARVLTGGGLVAFPTETVYGLGADARNDKAVARVFEAKGRPQFNPLIVHVLDLTAAGVLGMFSDTALTLARKFWPGALTLVVSRTPDCAASRLVSAGLDSIALRVPAHPLARALLEAAGCPVAAPSANRSGQISPTTPEHVRASLAGRVDYLLEGGACGIGLESTIVSCLGPQLQILRPGGIAREDIETVAGPVELRSDAGAAPVAPGQSQSHYAPRARLRLNARDVQPGEALLAFGSQVPECEGICLNLSRDGDPVEAAANLFAHLHELDNCGAEIIAVMTVPEEGLGAAINDRLKRAAAPRS